MNTSSRLCGQGCKYALVLLTVLGACGDDGGKQSLVPETTVEIVDTETVVPETTIEVDTAQPEEEFVQPPPPVLAYDASMVASNGLACTSSCAMRRVAGEDIELAVTYRQVSGQPLKEVQISWNAGDAPTDLARLNALSSYTDDNGVARATVRSGGLAGSATITARVTGDATATLTFVLTYDPPAQPDLAASFEYLGQESFVSFQMRAFKQVNGVPSCSALHPDSGGNQQPQVTLGPLERGQQARVATLPGLAAEGQQTWAVQFIGPHIAQGSTEGNVALAVGCVDGVAATAGQTATALVYVTDLPKNFRGTYQTVTRIDSLSGGEGTTIGNVLITLTELFTHPGRLLVVWACGGNPSGTLGTVCGWVTNGSGEPNILGGVITDAADAALLALFEDAVGSDIQDASELISEMLRDLRLVNTLTLSGEPSTSKLGFNGALFAPGDVREEYTHVRFRWKHDPGCKNSPTPLECGWTSIPLEQVYGLRPTASPEAGIDMSLALHVTPHVVPQLTYGPLINAIIEKRILPLVFASGGDEPLDTWDDFVSTLFGDRACLDYDDCCEYFAERLEGTTVGEFVSYETRALACELAIPLVASVIRNQLQNLDGALNIGTYSDRPCAAVDGDSDRWIDAYGPNTAPCAWDLYFPIGNNTFRPDNDWRSIAQ